MNSDRIVIIVAGGAGSRMGTDIPKQFLLLQGKPILMHTLQVFGSISSITEIILVLPGLQIDHWSALCKQHNFNIPHSVVKGGETRFNSVSNGLAMVNNMDALVAIHDGVRPLVSVDVIENCFIAAAQFGNAIPVIKPVESIRLSDGLSTYPFDRDKVSLVQTPQVFKASIIKKGYESNWQPSFTDDASVAEFSGERIHLIEGNRENIKITSPLDLAIAEVLINNNK